MGSLGPNLRNASRIGAKVRCEGSIPKSTPIMMRPVPSRRAALIVGPFTDSTGDVAAMDSSVAPIAASTFAHWLSSGTDCSAWRSRRR
jgi:hypothetical protein